MTMRALIVDDERLARRVLERMLAAFPDIEVVGEANGLDAAVTALEQLRPDLVFLDVQMPGGDGTQLFERTDVRARVIFVTAWDQYAVRAFELNALDYLLKPVDPQRLGQAVERARASARFQAPPELSSEDPLANEELLCLPHRGGMRFFRVRDLVHLAAADDYCELHLSDGVTLLSSQPLKVWEARLPTPAFLRVHRSHVVHMANVQEVSPAGSSYEIRLDSGATVPMSRRRASDLLERLGGSLK